MTRDAVLAGLACLMLTAGGCGERPTPARVNLEIIRTSSGAEMVLIPAGSFRMGGDAADDERPVHTVQVDSFLMDRCEVTQKQFARLKLHNPSHFKGDTLPVDQISWFGAIEFCNARSKAEGLEPCYDLETERCNFDATGYRLPTEAEWEYACRAGSSTPYFFGSDAGHLVRFAWFDRNSDGQTHPVGQKAANPWGLFNILGNVMEWCHDAYDKDYYAKSPAVSPRGPAEGDRRVVRGGAWESRAAACRSSARAHRVSTTADSCLADNAVGFRCVRRATGALQQAVPDRASKE